MLRSAELTFRDIAAVARLRALATAPSPALSSSPASRCRCLVLASAGVLMLGRAHDPGSIRSYTASHKALKIALVEPAQQAQMEPVAVASAAPSGPDVRIKTAAVHDNIRAPAQQAAALKAVPLPRVKPRAMMAAAPLPRERVAEKAPELSAPVVVAAVASRARPHALYRWTPHPNPPPQVGGRDVVASPRSAGRKRGRRGNRQLIAAAVH